MDAFDPFGLGAPGLDAASSAAAAQARELQGKPVMDVHGVRLGHVTRSFARAGALVRFDVALSPEARSAFHVERTTTAIPAVMIADVDADRVLLSEPGDRIVRGGD